MNKVFRDLERVKKFARSPHARAASQYLSTAHVQRGPLRGGCLMEDDPMCDRIAACDQPRVWCENCTVSNEPAL